MNRSHTKLYEEETAVSVPAIQSVVKLRSDILKKAILEEF